MLVILNKTKKLICHDLIIIFNSDFLDSSVLYCIESDFKVQRTKKVKKFYFITQHLEGAAHKKASGLKLCTRKSPLLKRFVSTSNRQ